MGFSRRKIPRSSAHTISEKAILFRHLDYNPDRTQRLISTSMSDICRHATFHPNPCTRFWAILLTDRQAGKRTNAGKNITFTSSFVGGKSVGGGLLFWNTLYNERVSFAVFHAVIMLDDDVWFKVAGMSMMISDCPLNSVNPCLF